MIKKRIIFTLLLSKKNFVLSRNFVHQKVGDINWLNKNYNFKSTSNYIDELIIINVDKKRDQNDFFEISQKIAKECFVPISYGGGINALEHHSESMEAIWGHIPGLQVVIPSTPHDAKGLLISSIFSLVSKGCMLILP